MRSRIVAAVVAGVGALVLIASSPVTTRAAAADCAPISCQSLDPFYDMGMWLYLGCWRPPCEIAG